MESTAASTQTAAALPLGSWRVDPSSSVLEFSARGMFGLVAVKGTFKDFEGELVVDGSGTRGELRIAAASLDTANATRDKHLRSADFFDVEASPTVRFTLDGVQDAPGAGTTFSGSLQIRQSTLAMTGPLSVTTPSDGHLALATALSVDRAAAGVGWSRMGMIRGDAHLRAQLSLTLQGQPNGEGAQAAV